MDVDNNADRSRLIRLVEADGWGRLSRVQEGSREETGNCRGIDFQSYLM